MVRLFFKIWPFIALKINPIISQICQSMLSILPNRKWTVKNLPNICKLLPKWCNFTKSGHTDGFRCEVVLQGPIWFLIFFYLLKCSTISVTRKKLPNVYKSCPNMISLEKWMILAPLKNCLRMWEALKSCPKCKKCPIWSHCPQGPPRLSICHQRTVHKRKIS